MAITVTFVSDTYVNGAIRAATSTLTVTDQQARMLVDLGAATAPGMTPSTGSPISNLGSYYAPLASPALTGTPTSTTAAADTNTTQIATTAFVVGQAGSTSPVMDGSATVGTSLKYAREDHVHPTDTSRAPVASPSFTGNATAAGMLISNNSSGDEGGELQLAKPQTNTSLAGAVSVDIYQNKIRFFENGGTSRGAYIDLTAASASVGSNLLAGGSSGGVNIQTFGSPTTSGTFSGASGWQKPAGAKWVEMYLWSSGGGGSSGDLQATSTGRTGGAGGGGGTFFAGRINAAYLSSTETVIVGAGGDGGASRSTVGTSNPGVNGSETKFSSYQAAAGLRAVNGNNAGAGRTSVYFFNSITYGTGGLATATTGQTASSRSSDQTLPSGGGGGGSAGAGVTTSAAGGAGGSFTLLLSSAGLQATVSGGSGGTVGGVAATNGTSATTEYLKAGTGGGGGYYITGVNGGNGGNGGWPGGGGGGGGAADSGFNSGAGGKGANGFAVIITYF